MEYADFALYGLAAGIIFGDVFFPEATPVMALLSSFAAYSVGFIARPIGALLFGWKATVMAGRLSWLSLSG